MSKSRGRRTPRLVKHSLRVGQKPIPDEAEISGTPSRFRSRDLGKKEDGNEMRAA
jgi:hypothetical protein